MKLLKLSNLGKGVKFKVGEDVFEKLEGRDKGLAKSILSGEEQTFPVMQQVLVLLESEVDEILRNKDLPKPQVAEGIRITKADIGTLDELFLDLE